MWVDLPPAGAGGYSYLATFVAKTSVTCYMLIDLTTPYWLK